MSSRPRTTMSWLVDRAGRTVLPFRSMVAPLIEIRQAVRQCLADPNGRRYHEERMSLAVSRLAFDDTDPQWAAWSECNRLLGILRDYDERGVRPPDCCLAQERCEHAVVALSGGWGNVLTAKTSRRSRRDSTVTGRCPALRRFGEWISSLGSVVVLVLLVVLLAVSVGNCLG